MWSTMLRHMVTLLVGSIDMLILGTYRKVGLNYLMLERLAADLGSYMGLGIIRQFQIPSLPAPSPSGRRRPPHGVRRPPSVCAFSSPAYSKLAQRSVCSNKRVLPAQKR